MQTDTDSLKRYIGHRNLTIVEAMKMIDKNSRQILYIVDDDNRLCGSLTDGDIRRGIIRDGNLNETIESCYFKNVRYVNAGDEGKAHELMLQTGVDSIPVIDNDHHITDIIFPDKGHVEKNNNEALKNTPVIVMAGGKGTRLYPYTKILPKPLIPIGDVPILERIFDRFHNYGVDEFYLTVNYKKEMIRSYFSEINPPYQIQYIEENKPLGTAGSISLIDTEFKSPVIVTNCDILIEAEYDKLLDFHKKSDNAMTVVSSLKNQTIPYGVLHSTKDGRVTSIDEKPELSYLINTGMYVVNPPYLKMIPKNTFYHMTYLMSQIMNERGKVGIYPISENSYLDMGQFEEMKKMEEKVREN